MRIMDRLSRILGGHIQSASGSEGLVLAPFEVRMIAEGKLDRLTDFATSPRLHLADPKGDTPLHLAARMGNLALCDLFIRSGADAVSLNHDWQTPAEVAFAEGHSLAARLLSSLVESSPEPVEGRKDVSEKKVAATESDAVPEDHFTVVREEGRGAYEGAEPEGRASGGISGLTHPDREDRADARPGTGRDLRDAARRIEHDPQLGGASSHWKGCKNNKTRSGCYGFVVISGCGGRI